ncbi:Uncharacterised protein [Providencia rustigianii]|nr:Uncharacterised protein [Providencia rustigianii]
MTLWVKLFELTILNWITCCGIFHTQKIPAMLAFRMYEERWNFVDEKHMSQNERQLIDTLTNFYGNGVFMAA